MGKQSSLGPVDPQFNGVPCQAILSEYDFVKREIAASPSVEGLWSAIYENIGASFIQQCKQINELSKQLLQEVLTQNMFFGKTKKDVEKP
jgi:hypothetical protein